MRDLIKEDTNKNSIRIFITTSRYTDILRHELIGLALALLLNERQLQSIHEYLIPSEHFISCYNCRLRTNIGWILLNCFHFFLLSAKHGKRWISCTMKMERSALTSAKHTFSTKSYPMDPRMMLLLCQTFLCWAQPHKVNTLLGRSH